MPKNHHRQAAAAAPSSEVHPLLLGVEDDSSSAERNGRLVPLQETNHRHHRRQQRPTHHRVITAAYRRHRYQVRKQLFACALAASSGFADVLCYHSFGCYGNMMTGNTIKLMDHMAAGRWRQAVYPAALVPAYILGAALCTLLSKWDLTALGLGGPSAREFSHLQPPRRLRSPQQISVLRVVAICCVVLFLLGEVWGCLVNSQRWRLPFFACAFGLLNAATLAAIHLVTNAVTGHWITVGLGVADDLPVLLNRQSSRSTSGNDTALTAPTAQPPVQAAPEEEEPTPPPPPSSSPPSNDKKWKSSMFVAASFLGSIIVTSLLYNECLREVQHHPNWPLALIFRFAPPMGVVFSVLYTALLYWYTLPPPFLRGFHSRVDLADMLMEMDEDKNVREEPHHHAVQKDETAESSGLITF